MKRLYRYALPLKNRKGAREGLILEWDGRYGEIAPLAGFSQETLEEAETEALRWIEKGSKPTLPSVRWGIECAQRELKSTSAPLSALGIKEGFSTVKLKLGCLGVSDSVALVKKYCGEVRLRLDWNKAWSLNQAIEFTKHFKPDDFEYMEEPVQTFEELVEFSKATGFPVALDESIHADWSKIPSLKAIVVKPTVFGSIPFVPSPLKLILSSSYESGLGLLHIANRAEPHTPIGLDTYSAFQSDLLVSPIDCSGGRFSWIRSSPLLDPSKLCAL